MAECKASLRFEIEILYDLTPAALRALEDSDADTNREAIQEYLLKARTRATWRDIITNTLDTVVKSVCTDKVATSLTVKDLNDSV